jgi:hypothetical protein
MVLKKSRNENMKIYNKSVISLSKNVAISSNVPVNTQVVHQWTFDQIARIWNITSAPLHVRISTCSLTLSNSAGFLWAIYLPPNTRLIHIRLTIVYCMILPSLISNLKLLTTLPGQIERCSSLPSPQSFFLSQILLLLIHLPFLHWTSPDKQSRDVVGATVVFHVGVERPIKETWFVNWYQFLASFKICPLD